jgi:pimeloyl-ACP methyl ester carboxylesterase
MRGMIISERRVTADNRVMRYLEAGGGKPLVLLHAFPLSADMWTPQLVAPPTGWRLIAPDLRGFRGIGSPATAPVGSVTVDDYARDVVALLDVLGIERVVVGGLSLGGYVTFALWRLAAARVQGLVLADTQPKPDNDEARERRRQMRVLVESDGASPVADRMLPVLLGETTRRRRPEIVARVRELVEANTADAIAGAVGALMDRPDSTPTLASIRVPALIVVGAEDTVTSPPIAEEMHRNIDRARLAIIHEAGHLSNLEQPEAFNASLAAFLSESL